MTARRLTLTEPKVRLVKASEAAKRLGISMDTWSRHYRRYFTDRRPPHLHGTKSPQMVCEDELDLWISDGPAAVLNYRRRLNRLRPDEE